MKQSEMNEQQREAKRKYDREAKQRSRAKEKADRAASQIPDAWDYEVTPPQQEQLTGYIKDTLTAIQKGGVKLTELDEEVIDGVSSCVFGFEHSIFKVVTRPDGCMVGGVFPDSAASSAVEHIHRYPEILQSKVFTEMYQRFLLLVHKWMKTAQGRQWSSPEFVNDVQSELAGTYRVRLSRSKLLPVGEPGKVDLVPSAAEILEAGRIQLLNQIEPQPHQPRPGRSGPDIAPAARKYLDGL